MTRTHLAAAALVAAALVAAPLPAAAAVDAGGAAWSVGPVAGDGEQRGHFDYALEPGQVVDDTFAVRNDGAATLTLRVYPADAFTTREGTIDLLPADTASVDSGTWIRLAQEQVTVEPGQTVEVPFTLTVPTEARPGDHPAGIVTSLLSEDDGAQVQVDRRLGTRVYLRVAGELAPAVEMSEPTVSFDGIWNPLALGAVDIEYTLRNTGDTRLAAVAASAVHGPFGVAAVGTGTQQLPEILPGSEVEVSQRLTGVAALLWLGGDITVVPASVGVGAQQLDTVIVPISTAAVPIATLLVLVALAAAVLVVVVVVRRRRTS